MKILHINSYYVSDFFYTNLYEYQKKNNDINIIVHKNINTYNDFDKEDCIVISVNNKNDRFFYFKKHFKIYNAIKQIDIDCDVIHAHTLFSNGLHAYKLHKDLNIPYIVAVRSTDVNTFFKYFIHVRYLAKDILLNASKIVFISESYKDKTLKYISKKYHKEILNKSVVIPNGVNQFFLDNKNVVKKLDIKEVKLIHVAKINKNKNALLIVQAIIILKKIGYNIKLICIGKVEDEKILLELLKYDFVSHYSFMSKEKLLKHYEGSDIFVLPSHKETFGVSYLEAMSQGLPVLYTKNEGFDKQFDEGIVGYSVDSKDPIQLSNKIIDVINNYETLSCNCIKHIEKYSWDIIGNKYDVIYKEVINDE